jgi:hypothetical protein
MCGERGNLSGAGIEESITRDEEGIRSLALKGDKDFIDISDSTGFKDLLDFQSEAGSGLLHLPQIVFGARSIGWIDEHRDINRLWDQVVQERQSLARHFLRKEINTSGVSSRVGQTVDYRPSLTGSWATLKTTDDGDRLTAAEVNALIEAVSDPDMARLVSAAKGFSSLCGIEWKDLLQEAFTRALEGRRTCERGTTLIPFICGVMKSFVSQENEGRKDGFRPTVVMRNGEPILPDVPANDPTPKRATISAIGGKAVLAKIEAAAAGDEKLQLLIEGIYDGMRGPELQDLLGVDEKGLAAVRKRLKRMLQKTCFSEMAS